MRKMWIYLAVPMAVLNGCQRQQALFDEAESLAVQVEEKSSQSQEGADTKEVLESGESGVEPGSSEAGVQPQRGGGEGPGESGQSQAQSAVSPKALAGAILGQNFIKEAPFYGSTVTIARSQEGEASQITEEEIEVMVREAAFDLDTVVKNGQTVVLKPNLVQMIVDSTGEKLDREVNGVTTDWRVMKAVLKMVREQNPDGKVYIMEGSATGPTREVMEYFKYTEEYMEGVDGFICLEEDCGAWQDFDAGQVVKVDLPDGLLHKSYYFNKILYEADVIISIPTLKTSSGVVVTAGIKNVSIGTPPGNLYGMGPDRPSKQKMVSHKITDGELDKWIYDYYKAKPVNYVIVDGLQGFQSGPVPMSSERRETDKMNMGLVIGGKDPVAVDTVCCLVMGWDPESVGYLNLFRERDGLGRMEDIRVKGVFADQVRKPFTIYKEGLGGTPARTGEGPKLEGSLETEGDRLFLEYQAGAGTRKLEIYVDGQFQWSRAVAEEGEEGTVSLAVPGLALGDHQVWVQAYDRFLNKTVKKFR